MRKHHRRSIRWAGYDYGQAGAYFVTICTHDHVCLFGRIVGEAMELNPAGKAVWECWRAIPRHFPQVALDEFIVMPNHVHGIIVIGDDARAGVGANNYSPVPGGAGAGYVADGGIDRAGVQDWGDEMDAAEYEGSCSVAAELLRACDSGGAGVGSHPAVYRGQSDQLDARSGLAGWVL